MNTAGIVLCGGESSRMGRAKAWLPWEGQPMVAHVVGVLRRVTDEVVAVSSGQFELPALDARVVDDPEPGLGPLAGIREGLAHVEADLAYVTSTDAPFLTPAFVRALLAHGCAAAPEVDGHVQTLAAVYPRSALPCAEALIRTGRMRPLYLLEAASYRKIAPHELPDLDSVRGFNTPSEYLEAVRARSGGATATLEFFGRSRLALGRRQLDVPVGALADVLAHARPALDLVKDGSVTEPFLVSLGGRGFVRDAAVPVGPGEHVLVLDSSVRG